MDLAVDPANPDRLWAASYTEGVWYTTNGGTTWQRTELCPTPNPKDSDPATWCDPSPDGVTVIAVDPTNPSILYAGARGSGLYKSTNGGATWAVANVGLYSKETVYSPLVFDPTTVFVDPAKPNIVFVGILETGIFRSTNGGQSFTLAMGGIKTALNGVVSGNLKSAGEFVYDPVTKNLLVGMCTGVYRSANGGASWVSSSKGIPIDENSCGGALQQSPVNPKLFVYYGSTGAALWGSADSGRSWKPLNTVGFCCTSGGNVGAADAMVFDAHYATTIYWGSVENGVYKTTNGAGL
jgi:hypothetical protein